MRDKLRLRVVIGGSETAVEAPAAASARLLIAGALRKAGVKADRPGGWDLRDEDSQVVDRDCRCIAGAGIEDGDLLFLDPREAGG